MCEEYLEKLKKYNKLYNITTDPLIEYPECVIKECKKEMDRLGSYFDKYVSEEDKIKLRLDYIERFASELNKKREAIECKSMSEFYQDMVGVFKNSPTNRYIETPIQKYYSREFLYKILENHLSGNDDLIKKKNLIMKHLNEL